MPNLMQRAKWGMNRACDTCGEVVVFAVLTKRAHDRLSDKAQPFTCVDCSAQVTRKPAPQG